MYILLFAIIGTLAGYFYRDIKEQLKALKNKVIEKAEVGVTPASYGEVKGNTNTDTPVGVVEAKTPEMLEFESQEKLRQDQFHVKVK
jgi:hypothetical protein